jgi:hypothetical protein
MDHLAAFDPATVLALLDQVELASGRAVQSRGKRNPRGVKRKMSNFRIRRRSEPLNQRISPKVIIK